jgi:23S rRNA pseudouridine1911/1915/1917 synthase
MLEHKAIQRDYQAIVEGVVSPSQFTIVKKIGRDSLDKRKRKIDERRGKHASTNVSVIQTDSRAKTSQLELKLDTGRTHQIRVHLQSIGHAILGDPLYSEKKAERLMLHAFRLSFIHPITKEEVTILTDDRLF